jgi:hypothetical protein
MAHKQMIITPKGAEFYSTRMLRAGDSILLSGPQARLQIALGYVTTELPRRAVSPLPSAAADERPTKIATKLRAPRKPRAKKAAAKK